MGVSRILENNMVDQELEKIESTLFYALCFSPVVICLASLIFFIRRLNRTEGTAAYGGDRRMVSMTSTTLPFRLETARCRVEIKGKSFSS